jgi:hypothetical protein
MPVSRGRKPRPRKPNRYPSPRQPQSPSRHEPKVWARIRGHPIWWLLGTLTTFVPLVGFVWQAFVGPDIDISETGAISAFAAPIKVANRSFIFTMQGAHPRCRTGTIKTEHGTQMIGGLFVSTSPIDIKPLDVANFQCRIVGGDPIAEAQIFAAIEYKTLWRTRLSDEIEFNWFTESSPPHWIKGSVPHH